MLIYYILSKCFPDLFNRLLKLLKRSIVFLALLYTIYDAFSIRFFYVVTADLISVAILKIQIFSAAYQLFLRNL